jgi:hypothetical protein
MTDRNQAESMSAIVGISIRVRLLLNRYIVDRAEAKKLKLERRILYPYAYRGAEVVAFTETWPNAVIIYPYEEKSDGSSGLIPESQFKRDCPNAYQHLISKKKELQRRMDSRKYYATGSFWYRYLRAGSFRYIHPPKLLIKGIDMRLTVGTLPEDTAFNGANCPGVILEEAQDQKPAYFLGILNSQLLSYCLRMVCPTKLGGYTRFNANNLNDAPIRMIDFLNPADKSRHDEMVAKVNAMVEAKKGLAGAQTDKDKAYYESKCNALDRQIDELVYDLYGLNKEEIAIVEQAAAE